MVKTSLLLIWYACILQSVTVAYSIYNTKTTRMQNCKCIFSMGILKPITICLYATRDDSICAGLRTTRWCHASHGGVRPLPAGEEQREKLPAVVRFLFLFCECVLCVSVLCWYNSSCQVGVTVRRVLFFSSFFFVSPGPIGMFPFVSQVWFG